MGNSDKEIQNNLCLISSIRIGDTLTKVGNKICISRHNSYFTGILRTYTGYNKNKTLDYINTVISLAIFKDIPIFPEVIQGLNNLRFTYSGWKEFGIEIVKIIKKINPRIMNIEPVYKNGETSEQIGWNSIKD